VEPLDARVMTSDQVPQPARPRATPSPLLRAAAAWPGQPGGPDTRVALIRRNGQHAAVVYRLDVDEHVRRQAAGQAPLTEPWQADALMDLPVDLPVNLLDSLSEGERRQLLRLPTGAVVYHGMTVIRRARPPLTVTFALISTPDWNAGLSAAGRYVPHCRRAMLLPAEPTATEALFEASLYNIGVGLIRGDGVHELLAPGPYRRWRFKPAQWTFVEEVYAQLDDLRVTA
jgi:hypothetical protein